MRVSARSARTRHLPEKSIIRTTAQSAVTGWVRSNSYAVLYTYILLFSVWKLNSFPFCSYHLSFNTFKVLFLFFFFIILLFFYWIKIVFGTWFFENKKFFMLLSTFDLSIFIPTQTQPNFRAITKQTH
jgi:hypothetical protein